MKRIAGWAVLLAVIACASAFGQKQGTKFTPPELLYATGIAYPANSGAAGLVTLCVNLDSSAHIEQVKVLRDIPSLTAPALLAVNDWTFKPAMLNGKPQASNISVNIVFNPGDPHPPSLPLSPLEAHCQSQESVRFNPPEVTAAVYVPYPFKSDAGGSVVLDLTVSKSGRIGRALMVQSAPSLTKPAIAAVKKWHFKAGRFDGIPIASKPVAAFVFRSPSNSIP